MPTLEKYPDPIALQADPSQRPTPTPMETGMRKLAPALMRAISETAEAFFASQAAVEPAWESARLPEKATLNCCQMNIGQSFELLCNFATDQTRFNRLFAPGASDAIKLDAYCELANCICGAILAEAGFAHEFGSLIPCVPFPAQGRIQSGARILRGAIRPKGVWIHFCLAISPIARMSCVPGYQTAA